MDYIFKNLIILGIYCTLLSRRVGLCMFFKQLTFASSIGLFFNAMSLHECLFMSTYSLITPYLFIVLVQYLVFIITPYLFIIPVQYLLFTNNPVFIYSTSAVPRIH